MKHPITTLALSAAALISTLNGVHAATFQAVVPEKSSVTFSYKQMGVAMDGKFKKFSAQIHLDPAKADKATGRLDAVAVGHLRDEKDPETLYAKRLGSPLVAAIGPE